MPRKHKSTAMSDLPAAALRSFSEAGEKAGAAPGMGMPGMGKPGSAGTRGRDERDDQKF
jgi:hypothetical protein